MSYCNQLGELLLKAVPTFLLVVLLQFLSEAHLLQAARKSAAPAVRGHRGRAQSRRRESGARGRQDRRVRGRHARGAHRVYQAQEQIYKQLQEQRSRANRRGPAARRRRHQGRARRKSPQTSRPPKRPWAGIAKCSPTKLRNPSCGGAPHEARRPDRARFRYSVFAPAGSRRSPRKANETPLEASGRAAGRRRARQARIVEVGELRGARRRARIPDRQECGTVLRGALAADPQGYGGSPGGAPASGSARRGGGSPPGQPGERDRRAPRRIADRKRRRRASAWRGIPPPKSPRSRRTPSRKSRPRAKRRGWN